jgi:hypothetical protein
MNELLAALFGEAMIGLLIYLVLRRARLPEQ